MSGTDTREQVFREFLDATAAADATRLRAVSTDDIVMRTPYAPAGIPAICTGIDPLIAQTEAIFVPIAHFAWQDIVVHPALEDDLLFATARSEVQLKSGKVYRNDYCFMTRLRDGKIADHTEYFNPLRVLEAFDLPG